MATTTQYYRLQGRISFAERLANGKRGKIRWAQNCPSFQLGLEMEEEEIKESHTGHRGKDLIIALEKGMTTEYSLHGFSIENLAAALWATRYQIEAGTVTGEALPDDLVAGDYFGLDHQNTSDWALTDSRGTPVELEDGTHFALISAFAGHGQILDLDTLTPPVLASYSYAASNALALFATQPDETMVLFDGIETISKSRCYLEIPRHQSRPISALQLINNEGAGTMEFTGEALMDGADPDFPFGKFVMAAAA